MSNKTTVRALTLLCQYGGLLMQYARLQTASGKAVELAIYELMGIETKGAETADVIINALDATEVFSALGRSMGRYATAIAEHNVKDICKCADAIDEMLNPLDDDARLAEFIDQVTDGACDLDVLRSLSLEIRGNALDACELEA